MLAELAERLVKRGWSVTVVSGPATEAATSSYRNGVRVERVSAFAFTRASTWQRALAYASLYPAFVARALRLPRPDIVVSKTDPPLQLVVSALLSRVWNLPAVHWAQDVYPEVAEELDVIAKGGWMAQGLRRVSTAALSQHDRVVAVGRCMQARIVARGYPEERTRVIPNWAPESVQPVPHSENAFRAEHGLSDRFVVMYSGNMGLAHPFDAVLDAAAHLQDAVPRAVFAFVGEGPRKADLRAEATNRGLDNVRFFPYQPFETLAHSLSAADMHLVTMQPELEGLVVPSKLYGVLAAGRPALFLGPAGSEAARVLRDHDCGAVLPQPTGRALARELKTWQTDIRRRKAAGHRAHAVVDDADARAASAFERILHTCIRSHMVAVA